MTTSTEKSDGRSLRRVRNREAIVKALSDHMRETGEYPTAIEIAKRADVSKSSVFRLFGDKATLFLESVDYLFVLLAERFPFPDLESFPVSERVGRLVDHIADVFEFVTPLRRVSARQLGVDSSLRREVRDSRASHYLEQAGNAIPLLGDVVSDEHAPLREAMRLLTSWDSWNYLRSERGLSVMQAKDVLAESLHAVLDRLAFADASSGKNLQHGTSQGDAK